MRNSKPASAATQIKNHAMWMGTFCPQGLVAHSVIDLKMAILRSITEWATSPWGQNVPIHIAWFLIWVAALAGLLFLIVHAIYVRYFAKGEEFAGGISPTLAAA